MLCVWNGWRARPLTCGLKSSLGRLRWSTCAKERREPTKLACLRRRGYWWVCEIKEKMACTGTASFHAQCFFSRRRPRTGSSNHLSPLQVSSDATSAPSPAGPECLNLSWVMLTCPYAQWKTCGCWNGFPSSYWHPDRGQNPLFFSWAEMY